MQNIVIAEFIVEVKFRKKRRKVNKSYEVIAYSYYGIFVMSLHEKI